MFYKLKLFFVILLLLVSVFSADLERLMGSYSTGQCPPCFCNNGISQMKGQGMGAAPGGFPSGGYPQGGTGGSGRASVWSGGGGTFWG